MSMLPWPERLSANIKRIAGDDIEKQVMKGCEGLSTLEEKAVWSKMAMEKLDKLVPDEITRHEIMAGCSCPCFPDEHIAELRSVYRKTKDIDELLEMMYKNPFYVKPIREGNTIYFTKMPYDSEKFKQAKTKHEKQFYYCHCEYARGAKDRISETFCYCGAGWYKNIMEGILEKQVKVTLEKSVLQGDDICQIAVHF